MQPQYPDPEDHEQLYKVIRLINIYHKKGGDIEFLLDHLEKRQKEIEQEALTEVETYAEAK